MIGKVEYFNESEGIGYIKSDYGKKFKFVISSVKSNGIPVRGDTVNFHINSGRAINIRIIARAEREGTMANSLIEAGLVLEKEEALSALLEIANWKTEAKLEDITRYFHYTNPISLIERGSRCFVIGRKGAGKTAICEYITSKKSHDIFAKKLSFKNFPFNEIYKYEHDRFTHPNQYITFWKYVIYYNIAQAMINNENIDAELRKIFDRSFGLDPSSSLLRQIDRATGAEASLKLAAIEIGYKNNTDRFANDTSWTERVEILEYLIYNNIDDSSYYICFDELDEDYKNASDPGSSRNYFDLITGLIKAVQDIKSVFKSGVNIFPVVFLRDDILMQLRDPDRSKWVDLTLDIRWTDDSIREMLAFRLARAIDPNAKLATFHEVWAKLVREKNISNRSGAGEKKHSLFQHISMRTHLRPRDYVRYLREAATVSSSKDNLEINANTITGAESQYSVGFRSELEDELEGVLLGARDALDTLAIVQKITFKFEDFHSVYSTYNESDSDENSIWALKKLFEFSVIGIVNHSNNEYVFKYLNPSAPFHWKSSFVVHRGLHKSLQL